MPAENSAVSLDLWHTLIYLEPEDEEAYMDAQMELAAEALSSAPPVREGAVRDRAELRRLFEVEYAAAVQASQRGESVTPERQFLRAAQRAGRAGRASSYIEGLRALVAGTPFRLGPGALETLRALRGAGFRTAVVSNTIGEPGNAFRPTLRALGFDPWVDTYVFSDEHPWTKPDPAIFAEVLGRLEVAPLRTIHVGDGWSDVEGARRAGLRAGILFTGLQRYGHRYHELFLPDGWTDPETDYRIQTLEQLPALAAELLGGPGQR